MKKNELLEVLQKGFNVAKMAELCDCSIGRINELKKVNDYEAIANHFGIDAKALEDFCKNYINVNAIFAFAEKHEINVEEWNNEDIAKLLEHKEKAQAASEIAIGTVLANGKKVAKIQKVGNSYIYITEDMFAYNQKEVKALVKAEA